MLPEAPATAEARPLTAAVRQVIAELYDESGAARFEIAAETFVGWVGTVIARYAAGWGEREQVELVGSLHVEELALARACAAGNEAAWSELMARFGAQMRRAAVQMTADEAAGRELADSLYADLYGCPKRDGRRVSRLDLYMGRGSLGGWLRTVLAQRHVDGCRRRKDGSLEEQMEAGVAFAAAPEAATVAPDARLSAAVSAAMEALGGEERFLLAAYYLDGQKLAAIGRQLGVHESTVSRKLEKATAGLRKRIRKRLIAAGMDRRRCDEVMAELDVRDLQVNVRRILGQEEKMETF